MSASQVTSIRITWGLSKALDLNSKLLAALAHRRKDSPLHDQLLIYCICQKNWSCGQNMPRQRDDTPPPSIPGRVLDGDGTCL